MDLELCCYLRSRGDGLESLLRIRVVWKQWTWIPVTQYSWSRGKMGLYDWRRDIELCSFYKNLLQPDLGLCNFAVAAFSHTYTWMGTTVDIEHCTELGWRADDLRPGLGEHPPVLAVGAWGSSVGVVTGKNWIFYIRNHAFSCTFTWY